MRKLRKFEDSISQSSMFSVNTLIIIMFVAIVLIEGFHLIFLTKYPTVFIDEPWYANSAWTWLHTGKNFDSMHAGARDDVVLPFTGNIPLFAVFYLFGVGLFQVRIVAWINGVLLLGVAFWVGKRSYGPLVGMFAALLLSLSLPFLWSSHVFRHDIILAASGLACFGIVLSTFERDAWWKHVLAGVIIGMSIDIHQNALLFTAGLGFLYLINYGKRALKQRGIWLFVAGVLIGWLYYVAIVILPNVTGFLNYYRYTLGTSHQIPLLSFSLVELLRSFDEEIGRYHFFENSAELILIAASLVYLLFRRKNTDVLLLAFILVVFTGFVLVVGNKGDTYAILLYPFFILSVSESLSSMVRDRKATLAQRAFVGAVILFLLFSSSIHLVRPVLAQKDYDYDAITTRISNAIPPDARVMGLPYWWLGFKDYDYKSAFSITYDHFIKDYTLTESLESIRPDILILDNEWKQLLVDEGYYKLDGFELYRMPREEFDTFLSEKGTLLDKFYDPWHGWFEIYSISWSELD